ncbi:NAD-dependent epimerase/dehydratase family protein, partial [bacterium]|nr:NAD-dependent epimerase/dehydratase family protein [bacterium]
MKITVVGGTGFIGNQVVKSLLSLGVELIVTGRNLEKAKRFEWFDDVEFLPLNINEIENDDLCKKLAASDKLINLSWEGLPNYNKSFHFESVLFKQYFFLKKVVEYGMKEIIVTGTCLEYGLKNGPLDVSMQTNPQNSYAVAKDTLRRFLVLLKNDYSFNLKWLRLFYMYGEGQSKYSILSQLEAAITNGDKSFNMSKGDQVRDYLPVEEVANQISNISLNNSGHELFNVCSGSPITIKELVENYISQKNVTIDLNLGFYPYPEYEAKSFWGV